MELTLKHLAPYGILKVDWDGFPVDLIGLNYLDEKAILEIPLCDEDGEIEGTEQIAEDLISIKPYFRPLSDLTKEIEHNGEKFVPMSRLGWRRTPAILSLKSFDPRCRTAYSALLDIQFLFEWHFDVFGLIEAGLAVDKNTIKE